MLRDFLKSKGFGKLQYVFMFPGIPVNKINNFSKYFNNDDICKENASVFIDNTVFGSGKEGVLFTEENSYYREMFESGFSIPIADIKELECKGSVLYVNGRKVYKFNTISKRDLYEVIDALREWISKKNDEKSDVIEDEKHHNKAVGGVDNNSYDNEIRENSSKVADALMGFLSSNKEFIVKWVNENGKERAFEYANSDDGLKKLTFIIYGKMPSFLMSFIKPDDVKLFILNNRAKLFELVGFGELINRNKDDCVEALSSPSPSPSVGMNESKHNVGFENQESEIKGRLIIRMGEPDDYDAICSSLNGENFSERDMSRFINKIALRHMWDVYTSPSFPAIYRKKYKLAYDFYNVISQVICMRGYDEGNDPMEANMAASLVLVPMMSAAGFIYIKDNYPLTNDIVVLFTENVEIILNATSCFARSESNEGFFKQVAENSMQKFLSGDFSFIHATTDFAFQSMGLTKDDVDALCAEAISATDKWIRSLSSIENSKGETFIYGWRELLCTSPLDVFMG